MRKRTWVRRLAQWTSGVAWASYLTRGLNKVVNRKTVVTFCTAEILVSGFVGYYFLWNKALVELLHSRSVIMGGCLIFRMLSATMGVIGAMWRKTRITRYYWCFLLINISLAFFIMCPFMRAKCECNGYWQCEVLDGYMNSGGTKMLNPFPPPNEKRFRQNRKVPYLDPPVPLDDADFLCQYGQIKCFLKGALYTGTKVKSFIQLNESFTESQGKPEERHAGRARLSSFYQQDAKDLSLVAKCCKLLDEYQLVPLMYWGKIPDCWKQWWVAKDCDKLVGYQTAENCEASAVEALVNEIKNLECPPEFDATEKPSEPAKPKIIPVPKPLPHGKPKGGKKGVVKKGAKPEKHTHDTPECPNCNHMKNYAKELMKFFNVTMQGISWESSGDAPGCNTYKDIDFRHASAASMNFTVEHLRKQLEGIQRGTLVDPNAKQHPAHFLGAIISRLSTCKRTTNCGAARLRVVPIASEEGRGENPDDPKASLEICLFQYPVVPRIPKPDADEDPGRAIEDVYFWKDQKKKKEAEREQTMKHHTGKGLMATALNKPTKRDAEHFLIENFLDACRCTAEQPVEKNRFSKSKQPGGCQVFYDRKEKKFKSWCEVSLRTVQNCKSKGIKLYQLPPDKYGPGRWWSAELCLEAKCKRSHMGMPVRPNIMEKARPEFLKLESKEKSTNRDLGQLLYGSDCKRWNKDDEHEWAYVGYESVCPDRVQVRSALKIDHADLEEVEPYVSQYRSEFICSQEHQQKIAKKFKDRCQVLNAIPLIALIVLTVLSIPSSVIVFKFLLCRCGDHFAIEAQFDAYFSDTDIDEDDFDVKSYSFRENSTVMTNHPRSPPNTATEDLHLAQSVHTQPSQDSGEHHS